MARINYGYAADGVTGLYGAAERISTSVFKLDGSWSWHVAVLVRPEDADAYRAYCARFPLSTFASAGPVFYMRASGSRLQRKDAIASARTWLLDNFNESIPEATEYRLERGHERAFPAPGKF